MMMREKKKRNNLKRKHRTGTPYALAILTYFSRMATEGLLLSTTTLFPSAKADATALSHFATDSIASLRTQQ